MPNQTGPKRSKEQAERDKAIISELMLKSYPSREIANQLNKINISQGYTISHVQVYNHTKEILKSWSDTREEMITNLVEREVAKLDLMEYEAWKAWEASKGKEVQTKTRGGKITDGVFSTTKDSTIEQIEKEMNGDPRYMMVILTCMDKRRDLLGYGAAKKVEHSGSVSVGIANMDSEEIAKERARMEKNFKLKKLMQIA